MKLHIDILIHNEHGELLDIRKTFSSMEELNAFMTDSTQMHELWCEAEKNGNEDGLLNLYESREDAF